MKKGILISILTIFIILSACTMTYADPNSSKGFAEYDDIKAAEETKELVEEQEKEYNDVIGKSTNNYLENLEIEGYEITPQFDKQTLEYVLNEKLTTDEINIIATASDEKAKIEGNGKIKIENNQTVFRIDVTAESGTVRTYMIYLGEQEKEEYYNEIEVQYEEPIIEETNTATVSETDNDSKDNTTKNKIVYGILFIIIVILFIIILRKKGHKKSKH